jgi:hypothetical protein
MAPVDSGCADVAELFKNDDCCRDEPHLPDATPRWWERLRLRWPRRANRGEASASQYAGWGGRRALKKGGAA